MGVQKSKGASKDSKSSKGPKGPSTYNPKEFTPGKLASSRKKKPTSTTNSSSAARIKKKDQLKKKTRNYTDKELNLPTLNTIVPAGVQKPKGKKKGKVFVDDAEGMRTILAIVSAEREGQIESKMQKARHLEEIREARRKEMDKKEQEKKRRLEEVKSGLRRKRSDRKAVGGEGMDVDAADVASAKGTGGKSKKRVSFG